ncbi:MAG: hypothetical protein PUD43_03340 [Clostridia bacterium]|nr:hypothetical protein [Clostridia bacterium]
MYGKDITYKMELLSRENYELVCSFSCGNEVIDDFLRKEALDSEDLRTYLFISENEVIAFVTLACSGIRHTYQSTKAMLSAIEIKYFAVLEKYHAMLYDEESYDPSDKNYTLSDCIFGEVLRFCGYLKSNVIGARYLVLYSVPNARHFYKANFLEEFNEYMEEDNIRFLDGCIPMYMELA